MRPSAGGPRRRRWATSAALLQAPSRSAAFLRTRGRRAGTTVPATLPGAERCSETQPRGAEVPGRRRGPQGKNHIEVRRGPSPRVRQVTGGPTQRRQVICAALLQAPSRRAALLRTRGPPASRADRCPTRLGVTRGCRPPRSLCQGRASGATRPPASMGQPDKACRGNQGAPHASTEPGAASGSYLRAGQMRGTRCQTRGRLGMGGVRMPSPTAQRLRRPRQCQAHGLARPQTVQGLRVPRPPVHRTLDRGETQSRPGPRSAPLLRQGHGFPVRGVR